MKFFREITPGVQYPMHTYLLSDNREFMYGFVPQDKNQLTEFKNRYRFDVRGRKFQEVPNSWGYQEPALIKSAERWEIQGSRGDIYTVERQDGKLSCSCSGFRFRGKCRHIEGIPA
jgi:hypothetical protein